MVAGMVRRSPDSDLCLQVHPCCAAHAHDRGAPCWAALDSLRRASTTGGGAARRWWLVPAKTLISSVSPAGLLLLLLLLLRGWAGGVL